MDRITCVLIDDERLARENLRVLLHPHPSVVVVGEADGVDAGRELIRARRPQLVFLDIQMPGGSGFDLLKRLRDPPAIIFVTAYDRYAIRAFEVNALDYLLKPVSPDRLKTALDRALSVQPRSPAPIRSLGMDDSVFLNTGRKQCFVPLNVVCAVRSEGNYTVVYTTCGEKFMVRRTLKSWASVLPGVFHRTHRNTIISLHRIQSVERRKKRGFRAVVQGCPDSFPVSRQRAPELIQNMKILNRSIAASSVWPSSPER